SDPPTTPSPKRGVTKQNRPSPARSGTFLPATVWAVRPVTAPASVHKSTIRRQHRYSTIAKTSRLDLGPERADRQNYERPAPPVSPYHRQRPRWRRDDDRGSLGRNHT